MMKTVDECKECWEDGRLLRCAVRELKWAWYCFMRDIPFFNRFAREPEPCPMRKSFR